MKKFLIAGSCLGAVAAAGSAGAVDVTLGGSIDMSMDFGVGKNEAAASGGFGIDAGSSSVAITLSLSAAGTTDAGMKYGGAFAIGTAGELEFDPLNTTGGGVKQFARFENTDADMDILGFGYMTSGGNQVTADQIVSVRINSSWVNTVSGADNFGLPGNAIAAGAICKVAGNVAADAGVYLTRATVDGANVADATVLQSFNNAGRAAVSAAAASVNLTPGTVNGNFFAAFNAGSGMTEVVAVGDALDADLFNVLISDNDDGDFADDDNLVVAGAEVYMGPEINVMLTSSTTKAVVGAVCVTATGAESNTKMYLDPTTNVMSASGASIFIDGGFGKLTLSTADYAGEVAAVAGAGDAAEIETTGIAAVLSSGSMMGLSLYGGVDLGSVNGAGLPNYLIGTSVDMGGLAVGFEIESESGTGQRVDNWDLRLAYSLGDIALGAALDSGNDWGISVGAAVAGMDLSMSASYEVGAHAKTGISIDGSLSTSLNGLGLTLGFDQELNYSLGMSYSVGWDNLALSAGYSSEDEGGSVGATLSF